MTVPLTVHWGRGRRQLWDHQEENVVRILSPWKETRSFKSGIHRDKGLSNAILMLFTLFLYGTGFWQMLGGLVRIASQVGGNGDTLEGLPGRKPHGEEVISMVLRF